MVFFEMLFYSLIINFVKYKFMKENMFKVNELYFIIGIWIMYNSDGWKMVMVDYILNDFKNKYL